jgi:hypothetical protein
VQQQHPVEMNIKKLGLSEYNMNYIFNNLSF